MQCQRNAREALSKLKGHTPLSKINVTSKSPVGDISVVTLIRTDTTLDHSQKAEKVCTYPEKMRVSSRRHAMHGYRATACDDVVNSKVAQEVTLKRTCAVSITFVGRSSRATCLLRNLAMDDSIGGS